MRKISLAPNPERPEAVKLTEKLIAKLILASSRPGDMVFDPFLGSGTTAVTAKKLGRHFSGIEINPDYCCWALARLEKAEGQRDIQGYTNGVFWERNTQREQKVSRLLVTYSAPVFLSYLCNSIYNIISRAYIGNGSAGHLGIAALSVAFPISLTSLAFAFLLGMGGSTLAAIRVGQEDREAIT